jgi:hypothetical protein
MLNSSESVVMDVVQVVTDASYVDKRKELGVMEDVDFNVLFVLVVSQGKADLVEDGLWDDSG